MDGGGAVLYTGRMSPKQPTGSTASSPSDPRPRAQISYEGEDEFSTMSLDPSRKEANASQQKLAPVSAGEKAEVQIDKLKATNEQTLVSFFRRIFAK